MLVWRSGQSQSAASAWCSSAASVAIPGDPLPEGLERASFFWTLERDSVGRLAAFLFGLCRGQTDAGQPLHFPAEVCAATKTKLPRSICSTWAGQPGQTLPPNPRRSRVSRCRQKPGAEEGQRNTSIHTRVYGCEVAVRETIKLWNSGAVPKQGLRLRVLETIVDRDKG